MKRNYLLLLVLMLSCYIGQLSAQSCENDTTNTDVLFLIDNSGSITDAEYSQLETIILASLGRLAVNCPDSRRGIVHYGGFEGRETIIEYPLSGSGSIMNVNRQFCTTRSNVNPAICAGGNGGDDLNNAIGDIMRFIDDGSLQVDTANDLKLVILTDAFNTGATCIGPACSVVLPTTNIDIFKGTYDAEVTVVGISMQAAADILGIYASPGGTYTDTNLNPTYCTTSFDGCDLPRRYVPIEFNTDPNQAADLIVPLIGCETVIIEAAMVDAGVDQNICGDRGEVAFLRATPTAGTEPFTYEWSNGLGSGPNKVVQPTTTTTYTVTMTDANNCFVTDDITVTALTCGPDCEDDTVFTDIILMIDNSGSITDAEFTAFEDIIITTLDGLGAQCPFSRRAVMHYGGEFGQETFVEYALGEEPSITGIMRQFCTTRNSFGNCNDGGDDLNFAMGELINVIEDGTILRNPNNNLSIVVLTDAFNIDDCATNPNCSVSLPTTNVDTLKSRFGASVTVVGISDQARPEALAISASPGGDFVGVTLLPDCANSLNGCELPRKYIPIEFTSDPVQVANSISACVECQAIITPRVIADAGPDQLICGNFGESATLTATGAIGVEPYTFEWSGGLGNTATVSATPAVTTIYSVTVTDANTCTDVDSVIVNVIECEECDADAGTPLPPLETCFENGRAFITAELNPGAIRPAGFEEVYFLTNSDLVIIDFVIGRRTFTVREPGIYRVHLLIAETSNRNSEDFFDLSVIEEGESQLFVITNCVIDHGVCADFDYPGRVHIILPETDMRCMEMENSITLCSDGIDNDNDGLVDCSDPECIPLMNCLENNLIVCNDLFDNDNDGLVDCFDPDCFEFRRCFERDELCNDGIDNDGDGLIDCLDDSCGDSASCIENNAFTCTDGIDNDNDGLIDCQEEVCQKFLVCAESTEAACTDGIDNDFDGLIDCADANCKQALSAICTSQENTMALCSDGIDNDADGLLDCDDPDCGITQFDNGNNLADFVTTTSATCPSNMNATIVFTLPPSPSSYEYSIDGGDSFSMDSIFTGVIPGNYTVAFRAAGVCTVIGDVVMVSGEMCPEVCNNGIDDDGDGLADCDDSDCGINRSVSAIIADPACPLRGNGVIRLFYTNATGGVSGLEYSIDNGATYQSSPIFRNLDGGRYNIRVRSSDGCEGTEVVTLSNPSCPEVCNNGIDDDGDGLTDCADGDCLIEFDADDVMITAPSCPALDDGVLTINLTGFTYRIGDEGSFLSTNVFSNLTPGDYILFVRNSNGCTANVTVTIDDFTCIEICNNDIDDDGDGLTDCEDDDCGISIEIEEVVTNATCPDNNNGSITVGVNTELEYSIDGMNFQSDAIFTDLSPGIYTLTALNANGCIREKTVTITGMEFCPEVCDNGIDDDGDGLTDCEDDDCSGGIVIETTKTDATCPDRNDGTISIEAPLEDLVYAINNGEFSSVVVFENLTAGTYSISAMNENGCITSTEVIINAPTSCIEICDNGIDDDGDGQIDCEDGDCNTIAPIQELVTDATCPELNNGVLRIRNVIAGIQYSIDDGDFSLNSTFNGLTAGTYTLNALNGDGCTVSSVVTVGGPIQCAEICDNNIDDDGDGLIDCEDGDCGISVDIGQTVLNATCPDNNNGSIVLSNDAELEYSLDGIAFSTDTIFENLTPGDYTITARNTNGCTISSSVTVNGEQTCPEICNNGIDDDGDGLTDCDDPDCGLDIDIDETLMSASCPDNNNGSIDLNIDGDFEYSIDSVIFQMETIFENLTPGDYTVIVRSMNGCTTSKVVTIEAEELCPEICDNGVDDDGDGLTDCDDPDCGQSIEINETLVSSTCPNNNDGQILLSGEDELEYSIDGVTFQMDTIFNNLTPGDYTIIARNGIGCTLSKTVTLEAEEICPEICDNGIDDDGDGLIDCDDEDCSNNLMVGTILTAATCPDLNDGIITINMPEEGLLYSLDGGDFTSTTVYENLEPGVYSIGVMNRSGCSLVRNIILGSPPSCGEICDNGMDDDGDGLIDCEDGDCSASMVIQEVITDATCPDLNNGIITIGNVAGGLQYALDDGDFSVSTVYGGLVPGTYTISARSEAGCVVSKSVMVGAAEQCSEICNNGMDDDGDGLTDCDDPDCGISILIEERVTEAVCPANNNGIIELINDTQGLEFSIDDVVFSNETVFDSLTPGQYRITARNGNGCLASKMIVVPGVDVCVEICNNDIDDDGDGLTDCEDDDCQIADEFTFEIIAECPGLSNGAIVVVPSSTTEYRFSLSGSAFQMEPEFGGLGQGTYDITVSTAAGCDTVVTAVVPVDTCVTASAAVVSVELDINVLLEGAYDAEIEEMTTFLNQGGYLPGQKPSTFFGAQTPMGQPFSHAPWFYEGSEGDGMEIYHPDVVDWVLVSLRTSIDKSSELCRVAALLHKDGQVEFVQPMGLSENNMGQTYYVVIEHRSHLPVMSAVPVPIVDNTLVFDFTQADSYKGVFGVGQREVDNGIYSMVSGNGELVAEISSDIDINARDLTSWLEMNGANSSYYIQDYDMNGDINIRDRILWERNNGLFSTLSTK